MAQRGDQGKFSRTLIENRAESKEILETPRKTHSLIFFNIKLLKPGNLDFPEEHNLVYESGETIHQKD